MWVYNAVDDVIDNGHLPGLAGWSGQANPRKDRGGAYTLGGVMPPEVGLTALGFRAFQRLKLKCDELHQISLSIETCAPTPRLARKSRLT